MVIINSGTQTISIFYSNANAIISPDTPKDVRLRFTNQNFNLDKTVECITVLQPDTHWFQIELTITTNINNENLSNGIIYLPDFGQYTVEIKTWDLTLLSFETQYYEIYRYYNDSTQDFTFWA